MPNRVQHAHPIEMDIPRSVKNRLRSINQAEQSKKFRSYGLGPHGRSYPTISITRGGGDGGGK